MNNVCLAFSNAVIGIGQMEEYNNSPPGRTSAYRDPTVLNDFVEPWRQQQRQCITRCEGGIWG